MSSPFNPLTALQPEPKPPTPTTTTPQPSQPSQPSQPAQPPNPPPAQTTLAPPSPITGSPGHPFLSPSGAGLAGLGAFAGLPGMGSIPALTSIAGGGGLGVMAGQGGMSGLSGGGGPNPRWPGGVPPETEKEVTGADLDDALRAIPDIARLLERAEGLLGGEVFGVGRVEPGQLEYAQTLLALISLTSSYLVGALPVPLSSSAGFTAPKPTKPAKDDKGSTATTTTTTAPVTVPPPVPSTGSSMPTLTELTAWIEVRAQTQFARREGIKVAAKAVGDVLKTGNANRR